MISDDLRQRRLALIREHMDTEVTQEFDATLATFNGHPHYEIMATGQTYDGDDEVIGYYLATRTAFPDQRHDNARFHVSDDAVIVEFDLLGTNLGEFYDMPPTGTDDCGVLLRRRSDHQRAYLLRHGQPGDADRAWLAAHAGRECR